MYVGQISHLTVIAIQVSAVVQDHALKCFAKEFPYISDFSVAKYLLCVEVCVSKQLNNGERGSLHQSNLMNQNKLIAVLWPVVIQLCELVNRFRKLHVLHHD